MTSVIFFLVLILSCLLVCTSVYEKNTHSLRIHYPYQIFDQGRWRHATSKTVLSRDYFNYSYSQDQEDIWLYENWFFNIRGGVILESGALDGIKYSTSFMFQKIANFTPIHIEADPRNYRSLISNREGAINIQAALCSEPTLLHFTADKGAEVQGFVEFMTPLFLKKFHNKIYSGKVLLSDLPTVQCVRVEKVLRELGVNRVDIWVLDIEGAELSVLQGMNFSELSISAIVIECDSTDESRDEKKLSLLNEEGYQCTRIQRNHFCRHLDFIPSAAPESERVYTGARNNMYSHAWGNRNKGRDRDSRDGTE